MKKEFLDYLCNEAQGHLGWAKILGDIIQHDPTLLKTDHKLLKQQLLRRTLGNEKDLTSLMALSLMETMGWRGEAAKEGKLVCSYLGLNWGEVQAKIHWFNENFSIAPLAGNYRYITPLPLAEFLAESAWETWPDLVSELCDLLPTEAKDKFFARLKKITSHCESARNYCRKELRNLTSLNDISSTSKVNQWSALATGHPVMALRRVRYL